MEIEKYEQNIVYLDAKLARLESRLIKRRCLRLWSNRKEEKVKIERWEVAVEKDSRFVFAWGDVPRAFGTFLQVKHVRGANGNVPDATRVAASVAVLCHGGKVGHSANVDIALCVEHRQRTWRLSNPSLVVHLNTPLTAC